MSDMGMMTPYSTVAPLFTEEPLYLPEEERERIAAYETYEKIYWSYPKAFKLTMRGTNDQPIYIPNPRIIVNETAHYLLKGLTVEPEAGEGSPDASLDAELKRFMKRERFYSKFHEAKFSGVTRGDWIMHITADPNLPPGRRISITSVDPASYFPIYDDDDLDKVIGVDLVEFFTDSAGKNKVKKLRYLYVPVGGFRRVQREEVILELEGWWKGKAAKVVQTILPTELLPPEITAIPVYHFKNISWQGDPFGSSELRGFETLSSSINQTISDEELALALQGLGVYATDSPQPVDDQGNEMPWEIAPASVVQTPTGTSFSHVKGITSVTPSLDHVKYLTDALFEGSSTFRTSAVDVQLAESGVALAIKFLPTLAKLEQRDWNGTDVLQNLFFDWKFWLKAYEGLDYTYEEIAVSLGPKLPLNRKEILNELNNMLDRMIIDRQFYRDEISKLGGYQFPKDIEERVRKEQEELRQLKQIIPADPTVPGNRANNSTRPNESAGTEAEQDAEQQQRNP